MIHAVAPGRDCGVVSSPRLAVAFAVARCCVSSAQALHKSGRTLSQRGAAKLAEAAEVIKTEVDAFRPYIPVVQVGGTWPTGSCRHVCLSPTCSVVPGPVSWRYSRRL